MHWLMGSAQMAPALAQTICTDGIRVTVCTVVYLAFVEISITEQHAAGQGLSFGSLNGSSFGFSSWLFGVFLVLRRPACAQTICLEDDKGLD